MDDKLKTITWRADDPTSVASALRVIADSLEESNPVVPPLPRPGFDSPVGTFEERASAKIWPGKWFDANRFLNTYKDSANNLAIHTGSDLNLNEPTWDSDRLAPVYAIANGIVTYAGKYNGYWRNIVIIRHGEVYARYAHLDSFTVAVGDNVFRGQEIGKVGRSGGTPLGPYHLHFDISPTEVLKTNPGHWPGMNREAVVENYLDPREYILNHRPPPP